MRPRIDETTEREAFGQEVFATFPKHELDGIWTLFTGSRAVRLMRIGD